MEAIDICIKSLALYECATCTGERNMKWQDALLRAVVAALLALAGALTEQSHPGVLSGLVPHLGDAAAAPLARERSELRLFNPAATPSRVLTV